MTLLEIEELFPTERAVVERFVRRRYDGQAVCKHCGSQKVYQRRDTVRVFDCNACGNTFSPFTGTMLEKSDTDLRKWVYAVRRLASGQGVSGAQLMREIGVTYKTAWRMMRQIKAAMGDVRQQVFLTALADTGELRGRYGRELPGRVDWSVPHVRVYTRGT